MLLGDELKKEWEKKLGYTIQCAETLQYLDSLNFIENTTLKKIVDNLCVRLPFSTEMRKGLNRSQKQRLVEELVKKIIYGDGPVGYERYEVVHPLKTKNCCAVVTTAPRREPTIQKCIESMKEAGWSPVVFAEPESIVVDDTKYIYNQTRLGAWHNWLKAINWALKHTTAEYILTVQDDSLFHPDSKQFLESIMWPSRSVQDDSLFHPDSKQFLESIMWPSRSVGFISLYTAKHYSVDQYGTERKVGVNKIVTSSLWGACALAFPRHVLYAILAHPLVESWAGVPPRNVSDIEKIRVTNERLKNPHLIQNVDTAIGRIMNSLKYEMYCIDPSPVLHVSKFSSLIGHGSNTDKRNCSRPSDHSKALFNQVFPQ